jgi:uridylate kinase
MDEYVDVLKTLRRQNHEVAVVVGGGTLARELIKTAKDLGLDEEAQDEVAILTSRIFAHLFLRKLGKSAYKDIALTIENAARCLDKGKVAVMGGLRPGMTTDTVAALIAEKVNADLLVKGTDQEGVYDKDPKRHADAVLLRHLSFDELSEVFAENKHKAGIHQIIDPEAVKILKRKRVKVAVINGFKPENILAAVRGERIGTIIE